MPNATSVWDFSDGEILTAAKLDDVNCGIHVFANATARTNAYGGTGERTLVEGEFSYLADTNVTAYYDGSSWQQLGGGLTLISTTTIGSAVSSVTVSNCFSATYDNYLILANGGATSTTTRLTLQLGASTTGYYHGGALWTYAASSTVTNVGDSNASSFTRIGAGETTGIQINATLLQPFAAARTGISSVYACLNSGDVAGVLQGFHNVATSYTGFTIAPFSGGVTMTGGTIRVYGYQNS